MNEILVVKIPVKKKGESVHMKKVVAMYEQEEAYGKNLAEYVNRKENMPFEVQVFSQADKLSDYLQVSAKNNQGGGLEFVFTLAKEK